MFIIANESDDYSNLVIEILTHHMARSEPAHRSLRAMAFLGKDDRMIRPLIHKTNSDHETL